MSRILTRSPAFDEEFLDRVKQTYPHGRFICEARYGTSDNHRIKQWFTTPGLLFYADEAHPRGSNWFSVFINPNDGLAYICDGISATYSDFYGIQADNGDIIYSRYADKTTISPDHSVWISLSIPGQTNMGLVDVENWTRTPASEEILPRVHLLRIVKDQIVSLTDPTAIVCHDFLYSKIDR